MMFHGLILDWDGVFHDGRKSADGSSSFSEIDSMGLNLLRYGYFRLHSKPLPVAIVTGERNTTAEAFAQREHIDCFMYHARDKRRAIPHLEQLWGTQPGEWAFVFDDVLDFGLAAEVGHRAMVKWPGTEQTQAYAGTKGLVDQWLPNQHAIRHFAESELKNCDLFEACVDSRVAFDDTYQSYWQFRQTIPTLIQDLSP